MPAIIDIIKKARDKKPFDQEELNKLAKDVAKGSVEDYHIAAFTMAIYLNGISNDDTVKLTKAYINSGDVIKWDKKYDKTIVDKHSTGGVGDKVSLIMVPLLAALGLKTAKLSGRGLGKTGGTLDKLESIKGFKTTVSEQEFSRLVLEHGMAIIGANKKLAPADKKIYAIRDVTASVGSIPLIAASIMSKKIAGGAKNIVIDLKVGDGAFMSDIEEASLLARSMKAIGKSFDRNVTIVLSDMDQPLGFAIGNAIEVIEAIEALKLRGPRDLLDLTIALVAEELLLVKKAKNLKEAKQMVINVIESKKALDKFYELIKIQGGDVKVLKDIEKFGTAKYEKFVKAPKSGYAAWFDTLGLGMLAKDLGAGREKTTDKLDYKAGIYSYFKIGDEVHKGDVVYKLQSDKPITNSMIKKAQETFKINKSKVKANKLIHKIIR